MWKKVVKYIKHNGIVQVGQAVSARVGRNDVSGNAAQLAYYMLFSIFPMLLIAATLLAYLHIDKDSVFNMIKEFAPDQIMDFLEDNLNTLLTQKNGGLLSIGIIATLWSASNGMNAVMKSLNKAYGVTNKRNYVVQRLLSMFFTLAMLATVGATLLLLVFGQQIGMFLINHLNFSEDFLSFWNNLRWTVTLIVIFVVFTFLYWVAPNRRSTLISVLPGALFSTIGWTVASVGFAYYVNNFGNYSATYGSIGVIIILMLWFYLTGIILMIGGELNATLAIRKKKKELGEIN
ncbi:YihY/virulence factor BrkB family protein [Listeria sp. FSL L7-0233]|uniref:YihY/virulence factor BrkB family protein n=1 Tax=Listeria cossartiae subsp. cayugensis TaxID=2713505 RepID=A0ABU2ITA5_9LIST|nr:YihY/virulence factor BrkB family protein [Listeria cossartiae]MBC1545394.1 YihY/virulence factor BrkB family protein [Listeria cossartiae subsp. cossartiae]MBC1548015.1 YihY/virulence factor BrkB family protein [Listeria cossartiae subsp. cossartiae]MBC1551059.1 YihY/virulence factor BrkB family protein [Listeria cossartiae subsp. cossartiae]MBC1569948.1 YihY/virulence factor BrkB family protein [Listeria cossartiae subsp. cossartiae]MBC1988332.1 YihY/virulence factor BrkB family protein [